MKFTPWFEDFLYDLQESYAKAGSKLTTKAISVIEKQKKLENNRPYVDVDKDPLDFLEGFYLTVFFAGFPDPKNETKFFKEMFKMYREEILIDIITNKYSNGLISFCQNNICGISKFSNDCKFSLSKIVSEPSVWRDNFSGYSIKVKADCAIDRMPTIPEITKKSEFVNSRNYNSYERFHCKNGKYSGLIIDDILTRKILIENRETTLQAILTYQDVDSSLLIDPLIDQDENIKCFVDFLNKTESRCDFNKVKIVKASNMPSFFAKDSSDNYFEFTPLTSIKFNEDFLLAYREIKKENEMGYVNFNNKTSILLGGGQAQNIGKFINNTSGNLMLLTQGARFGMVDEKIKKFYRFCNNKLFSKTFLKQYAVKEQHPKESNKMYTDRFYENLTNYLNTILEDIIEFKNFFMATGDRLQESFSSNNTQKVYFKIFTKEKIDSNDYEMLSKKILLNLFSHNRIDTKCIDFVQKKLREVI